MRAEILPCSSLQHAIDRAGWFLGNGNPYRVEYTGKDRIILTRSPDPRYTAHANTVILQVRK